MIGHGVVRRPLSLHTKALIAPTFGLARVVRTPYPGLAPGSGLLATFSAQDLAKRV
jgi:hypothetical protein